jgi:hypothetical protein
MGRSPTRGVKTDLPVTINCVSVQLCLLLVAVQVTLTVCSELRHAGNVLTNGTVASSFTMTAVCTYEQPEATRLHLHSE